MDRTRTTYHKNGIVSFSEEYKEKDDKGQMINYHENGIKMRILDFVSDENVDHGDCLYYHENGILSQQCSYIYRSLNGEYREWYENGQIKCQQFYEAYHIEGKLLSDCTYWDWQDIKSKYIGEWIEWYQDGNLKSKQFYDNGNLIKEEKYEDQQKLQLLKYYYPDGQIQSLQFNKHTPGNLMNGDVKKWYQDGQLQELRTYKDGDRLVKKYWYPSGQIYYQWDDFGQKYWHMNGQILSSDYNNEYKEFYQTGDLKEFNKQGFCMKLYQNGNIDEIILESHKFRYNKKYNLDGKMDSCYLKIDEHISETSYLYDNKFEKIINFNNECIGQQYVNDKLVQILQCLEAANIFRQFNKRMSVQLQQYDNRQIKELILDQKIIRIYQNGYIKEVIDIIDQSQEFTIQEWDQQGNGLFEQDELGCREQQEFYISGQLKSYTLFLQNNKIYQCIWNQQGRIYKQIYSQFNETQGILTFDNNEQLQTQQFFTLIEDQIGYFLYTFNNGNLVSFHIRQRDQDNILEILDDDKNLLNIQYYDNGNIQTIQTYDYQTFKECTYLKLQPDEFPELFIYNDNQQIQEFKQWNQSRKLIKSVYICSQCKQEFDKYMTCPQCTF